MTPHGFISIGRQLVCAVVTLVIVIHVVPVTDAAAWSGRSSRQQLDSQEIRNTSRRVMRHQDFRSLREDASTDGSSDSPGFLQRIFDTIERFFDFLFSRSGESSSAAPSTSSFGLAQVILLLAIIALLVIVTVIIVAVIRSIDARKSKAEGGVDGRSGHSEMALKSPPGEMPSNIYAQRAQQLAQNGDYAAAMRQLLLGEHELD